MGNILRKLCSSETHDPSASALDALARDLLQFEKTGQVPEGLDSHVHSSRTAQTNWYNKLLVAWKANRSPPSTDEEICQFVLQTLKGHRKADVEGLLRFYGLSSVTTAPAVAEDVGLPKSKITPPAWPQGVQYELWTLPVERHHVLDGDTLVVFVDVNNNAREAAAIPKLVQETMAKWRRAQQKRDYGTANALQKQLKDANYKISYSTSGKECITRKYKIRLRGVDAPESNMPFGPESTVMLQSLVENQCIQLLVYNVDMYGRLVADIHCKNGFVQEILLKNGACWHYYAYDKRKEFAKWEEEARARSLGLWALPNPQKPWEFRRESKSKL